MTGDVVNQDQDSRLKQDDKIFERRRQDMREDVASMTGIGPMRLARNFQSWIFIQLDSLALLSAGD